MYLSHGHGRSTFEFPSRVNLSGPMYLALWTGLAGAKKVDAVRLYASYRLNLLLPKWQICVVAKCLMLINNLSFLNLKQS